MLGFKTASDHLVALCAIEENRRIAMEVQAAYRERKGKNSANGSVNEETRQKRIILI